MRAPAVSTLLLAAAFAPGAEAQPDFQRITCPVVGTFVKNGQLVPDPATNMITREQTLEAFLAAGVPEGIAVATTNGNFKSDACPLCPDEINPFEMNTVQGRQASPDFGPQEHFRSTGIRDGFFAPSAGAFDFGEAECLPAGATAWTLEHIMCFTNVWDRDEFFFCPGAEHLPGSNDISTDKRPAGCGGCDSFKDVPACHSALIETILFMFEAFKNPATGTFDKAEYRAMWLDLEFPTGHPVVVPATGTLFEDTFAGEALDDAWAVSTATLNEELQLLSIAQSGMARVGPIAAPGVAGAKVSFRWKTRKIDAAAQGMTVSVSEDGVNFVPMMEGLVGGHPWRDAEFEMMLVGSSGELFVEFKLNAPLNRQKVVLDMVKVEAL